jgi:DNA-directed RNA polymerase alpha subunit
MTLGEMFPIHAYRWSITRIGLNRLQLFRLKCAGITTVEQLLKFSQPELVKFDGINAKTVYQIKRGLDKMRKFEHEHRQNP